MQNSAPYVLGSVRRLSAERLLCVLAASIALGAAVNAYSYSATAAIPLIQSDAWYFLDGFLGRFLEYGFSASDVFRQANPADTNLPLQKLFLFFHTRFFGMDFRLEGILATVAAVASVAYFSSAAARRPLSRWGVAEYGLLATLALLYLSLNSTNIYTWPLAGMWFVPLLIAAVYFSCVTRDGRTPVPIAVASLLLGLLLDEVAYLVFAAAVGSVLLSHYRRSPRTVVTLITAGAAGIAVARLVYWWFNRDVIAEVGTVGRSFTPLLAPDVWKAVSIPLTESVVAQANVIELLGASGAFVSNGIWMLLAIAHAWFWWRVICPDPAASVDDGRLTRFAAALMLLFYGLVLGIVVQRVPTFGFDYLHQPRYVMFYQLNVVALVLMAYRQCTSAVAASARRRAAGTLAVALLLVLQWQLSVVAWKQVKYLSVYLEGVSRSIGNLQADPASTMKCADIMTVCNFPPAKRAELLDRLLRYRMNIFSTDFQGFYRLHPYPAPAGPVRVAADAAPSTTFAEPAGK